MVVNYPTLTLVQHGLCPIGSMNLPLGTMGRSGLKLQNILGCELRLFQVGYMPTVRNPDELAVGNGFRKLDGIFALHDFVFFSPENEGGVGNIFDGVVEKVIATTFGKAH